MCLTSDYRAFCIIGSCLYLTCHASIEVLGVQVWYEVIYSLLSCAFVSVVFVHVAYSKIFLTTKWLSKKNL